MVLFKNQNCEKSCQKDNNVFYYLQINISIYSTTRTATIPVKTQQCILLFSTKYLYLFNKPNCNKSSQKHNNAFYYLLLNISIYSRNRTATNPVKTQQCILLYSTKYLYLFNNQNCNKSSQITTMYSIIFN